MKEELEKTLKTAETATIIYMEYINEYQYNWPEKEKEEANKTLGVLKHFCNHIDDISKAIEMQNITKEQEPTITTFLNKVNSSCNHIIINLEKFITV